MGNTYVCCFTGHRKIAYDSMAVIPQILDSVTEKLIANGVTDFRVGGALGFDTVAALKVLEKKDKYPFVRLHLFLPCKNQTEHWSSSDKRIYFQIAHYADSITYTSDEYFKGCMALRNRRLVDGSDFCIAYCTKNTGGSAYTLNYAKEKNLSTFNIASTVEKYKSREASRRLGD